jgi:ribosome recycling factor
MSELADLILDDARERMDKAIAHSRQEFSSVRSGRASPELVERIPARAYGVEMRVQELATISIPEARQLLITPHDPTNLDPIEKAISMSGLGLTPSNDGRSLRLNFPPLTEERRKELVRMVKKMAEEGRISIRNIRRDARKELEALEKDNQLTNDELARAEKDLDRITQSSEATVDGALAGKEDELLEV